MHSARWRYVDVEEGLSADELSELRPLVVEFSDIFVSLSVEDMLDQGIVVPSKTPWASPIVLVAKKDDSTSV